MNKFEKIMNEYENKFGDIFPTMCFQTDTDKELMEKAEQCLKAGQSAEKLFELDYKNNAY